MAAAAAEISVAGEVLYLLAERAALWPRERLLFVADIHLGKAASFRAGGIPTPHGTTETDLLRLGALLQEYQVQRVCILGDLLHAKNGMVDRTIELFGSWRSTFPAIAIDLVSGNHDLRSGAIPASWNIETHGEQLKIGPFLCTHDINRLQTATASTSAPSGTPRADFTLSGHVHPVVQLHDQRQRRTRLPCFVLGQHDLLFPAFTLFAGGWTIKPRGERVFVIHPEGIQEVSYQAR